MKTAFSILLVLAAHPGFGQKPPELGNAGIEITYDIHNGRLRQTSMLPRGDEPLQGFGEDQVCHALEVAIHCTGEPRNGIHGNKITGGNPGSRLTYRGSEEVATENGRRVTHHLWDEKLKLKVESIYEITGDIPVVRRRTRVTNEGDAEVGIAYVSSAMVNNFNLFGSIENEKKLIYHYATNSWYEEAQWKTGSPSQLGLGVNGRHHFTSFNIGNTGARSTISYLPMGMVENREIGVTWFWQIEHNGSWYWETSNYSGVETNYIYMGGPDEEHHHAWKNLKPGESYETVPVGLGCVKGGFQEAVDALTDYRRKVLLRPHRDNRECPVIFNDFMNCLFGDPTTEKELPLIDAAAGVGCEYFVIDAGWYGEKNEPWWNAQGDWIPGKTRFPNGIDEVFTCIRRKDMVPGIWLEIEVAGTGSRLQHQPDDWFFTMHGKRVIDANRMQLDFRNPEVRSYCDEVIRRVMVNYGAGYIKMDYNMDPRLGTDKHGVSPGQGLLEHQRAYLKWFDTIYEQEPELIIENCASGGCRMDYAMMSRHQLQSSSDQTDYRKYPKIFVGTMAAVLPEQLAVWSYPLSDGDAREASFNMVNAMLGRIHQSGHIANLPAESYGQVKEGIRVYKERIRRYIPESHPFFPLGMPDISDDESPVAVGLRHPEKDLVAVWCLEGSRRVELPKYHGKPAAIIYPTDLGITVENYHDRMVVEFPEAYMGSVIEVAKSGP